MKIVAGLATVADNGNAVAGTAEHCIKVPAHIAPGGYCKARDISTIADHHKAAALHQRLSSYSIYKVITAGTDGSAGRDTPG